MKKALGCLLLSNSPVSTQAVGDEDVRKPVRGRIRPPSQRRGCPLHAFYLLVAVSINIARCCSANITMVAKWA